MPAQRSILASCALLLLFAANAHAEPKDDARRHFRAGLEAVQEQDLDVALQHFLAAQDAYPHEATIYNIARVYADMGDLSNALAYYRMFREQSTDGEVDVDPVIQAIEARIGAGGIQVTAPTERPVPGTPVEPQELSEAERARLGDIQAELETLASVFGDRGAGVASENVTAASQRLANVDSPAVEPIRLEGLDGAGDITELDLAALGVETMLTDAYERSVVTASRYGQDPLDSPSTVSVLTSEDIRLSGVTSLPELLRRVTAVDVAQMASGHADVSIRGFNRELNNKVLVLIDGRSTYWDFIGATLWETLEINLEDIDRIEIIRGPGSAVYGANAVTGVINIITRVPGERPETKAVMDMGTVGMRRGTVTTNGVMGEHRYRISAGYKQHGRWSKEVDLTEEEINADDSPFVPFREDQTLGSQSTVLNGRVDRSFGRMGFASVSGGWNQGFMEYYSLGALENYGLDYSSSNVRGDLSWGVLHLRSFYNGQRATSGPWLNPKGIRYENDTRIAGDTYDFELEAPVDFTTGSIEHRFNVGVGYRQKQIALDYLRGGFDRRYIEHHFSAFFNEEMAIDRVKLVGSMRVDRHPLIPDIRKTISPRLAGIVRVADATSIRATAGTAFRAPNTLEIRSDFELPTPFDGAYILVPGDPKNPPVRIWTAELGLHDESSDYHVADVVFFVNNLTNPSFLPDPILGLYTYDEARQGFRVGTVPFDVIRSNFLAYGVEAEGRVFPTDGMDLFVNVDWQQVQFDPSDFGNSGLPTFLVPAELKVNGGWMYRTPIRTDLTLMANYVSAMSGNASVYDDDGILQTDPVPLPAHVLLSARLAVRPFSDENLELAATGWNLTAPPEGFIENADGQWLRSRVHGTVMYKF